MVVGWVAGWDLLLWCEAFECSRLEEFESWGGGGGGFGRGSVIFGGGAAVGGAGRLDVAGA